MTEIEPIDWEARLRAAVAETLAQRAARRAEREQFETRRAHGLEARHARKLGDTARGNRGTQQGRGAAQIKPLGEPRGQEKDAVNGTPSGTPVCCVSAAGGECEQHRQAQQVNRFQGPRRRSAGGTRVLGDPGTAKPAPEPEERP